jgi:hypothetical protein
MRIRGLLVVLVGAAIALTGCGAKEAAVVKSAFQKDIKSANVDLRIGVKGSQGTFNISVTGPYKSNGEGKLPSAELTFKVDGAPEPIEGKLISTGANAFVEYEGETYEVGEEAVAQIQKEDQSDRMSTADLSKLMTAMSDWFPESDASDAELGGEPVDRVTGELDVSKALKDLKSLAEKSGGADAKALKGLSTRDIDEIDQAISDPKFAVDVAKSDGKLRRVEASLTIKDRGESDALTFALQLSDVDKPVTIDAPTSGRPIQELLQKLSGGGNEDMQIN